MSIIQSMIQLGERRPLAGRAKAVSLVVAFALPLLVFYCAGPPFLGSIGTGIARGFFILLASCLVLMLYPFGRRSPAKTIPWYDGLLMLLAIISFGYFAVYYLELQYRVGDPTTLDVVMGVIAVLISLEVTRRVMGVVLAGLGVLAVLYALFGDKFPLGLFTHQGFSVTMVASFCFSLSGIFGFVLRIIMIYVVMFVLVGALLRAFGASIFFIELPWAIFARRRGGPAMAAVGASTLMGMISGSATANTAATGAFTIPLMKRTGYPPEVAGAIEPAASTGGMFMPPIMGVGAFIMADLTRTPYIYICLIGLVPALIYFFSVLCFCYTEALRNKIPIVPASERPAVAPILKRGWFYVIPIIILIVLLLQGFTPPRAAWSAVVSTIIINIIVRLVTKERGTTYPQLVKGIGKSLANGLRDTAEGSLVVVSLIGTIGIIVAVIFLTGVGFMFTTSMMALTLGLVPLVLLVALVVCYILGMGMTVTTVYILLALLIAPAMGTMGMPLLAAHFLLFWWSQSSNISPPVAIAAYVGAGIAQADPIRTAFNCFKYAAFLLLFPLLFIYSPILMLDGFNLGVLMVMVSAFLSAIPFAGCISGYLLRQCSLWERLALVVSFVTLFIPEVYTSIIGFVLLLGVLLIQARKQTEKEVQSV